MTAIFNATSSITGLRAARLLLLGASGLALSAPLAANELLFTTSKTVPETGQRIGQSSGLTQVALTGGGVVSIVDAADYRINADGSVDLYEGTVTVAAGPAGEVVVRMPEGVEGRVAGQGSAGNFSARKGGEASGHALTGSVRIGRAGAFERFAAGAMWRAEGARGVRRVVANGVQAQPGAPDAAPGDTPAVVAIGSGAGPVAAALNGIPTGFGDQLAAAGASSDILAAARRIEGVAGNPALDTFPSGDLALLVAAAAQLEGAYGGTPFPAAQADIIRAYLRFLAGGGAGSAFLASYSRFAADYLDLIRSGGLPSSFAAAGPQDVDAWLAYIRRTGAISGLAARDRVLADAYLSFLASGGNRDAFARSFTDLTTAYFAFVRGGGDPAAFAGANAATLTQTIAFLRDSGLAVQLTAADRALIDAYLANGGLAFAGQYRAAFADYSAFLASGRRPSEYTAVNQATLMSWLETLERTGLLTTVLGNRAGFYADYLAYLRAGGTADGFARLPANIFAGYAVQLDSYFAFLATGRRPSEFTAADIATLQAFLLELQAAGALERFLGERASFFADYAAFVAGGGSVDAFARLPANIFAGYAVQLDAYFAFLAGGRLPSEFTATDLATLQAWLVQLQAAGALERFLGDRAAFFADYAAFVAGGGSVDAFALLPANIFAGYATNLRAFFDFLEAGGVPSGYTLLTPDQIRAYIAALDAAGAAARFLGDAAGFWRDYAVYLAGGGNPDLFAGLPVPPDFPAFAAALNAYAVFLQGGGLPSSYTAADLAALRSFIDALVRAGQLETLLGANAGLLSSYFTFLAGGGSPDGFAGLPVYASYISALNAYFAFLQGGGLPGDYTVLDQTTINAYLAALANAQGGLTGFANLESFFTAYSAFVLAGGNPAQFAGLPAYAGYVAALNAYFAFLQGGGLPSAYAALDAATIEAYLAALAAVQGGLTAIAGLDPFFAEYFTFIIGGGNPDLFAGLPGNGGGGGGGGPTNPLPPVLTGYTGGFNPETAKITFILGGQLNGGAFVGSEIGFDAAPYTLDANGGLASYTRQPGGQVRNRGAAQQTDIFGNGDAVIGRWTNGTISIPNTFTFNANQGLHYILTRPVAPNILNTLTGRIDYYQIAATRPTIANGSLAPGVFNAGLAIALGGEYRLAAEGMITMPNGNNPYIFSFATRGGLANPSQSESIIGANAASSFAAAIPGSDNAGTCTATPELCVINLRGVFAGDTDTIGVSYEARTGTTASAIIGTAIFEAGPTRTVDGGSGGGGGGGGGGTVTAPPYTGTVQGLRVLTTRFGIGSTSIQAYNGSTVTFDADGNIATYTNTLGSTAGSGQPLADADEEAGSIAGAVAWARFLDPANAASPASVANTGVHTALGAPATNLPTTGTITYTMIGGTRPTTNQGTAEPGSFSGALAIDFGARRVGIDFNVAIADRAWRIATAGGAANPSNGGLGFSSNGITFFGSPSVTGLNAASCTAGCTGDVIGTLFGAGGAHAGAGYRVVDGSFVARGLGVFAAPGAAGTPTPVVGGTSAFAGTNSDWSRWDAPATASAGSAEAAPLAALAPATLTPTEGAAMMLDPADREGAMRQAERLMGGMISFAAAPGDAR